MTRATLKNLPSVPPKPEMESSRITIPRDLQEEIEIMTARIGKHVSNLHDRQALGAIYAAEDAYFSGDTLTIAQRVEELAGMTLRAQAHDKIILGDACKLVHKLFSTLRAYLGGRSAIGVSRY